MSTDEKLRALERAASLGDEVAQQRLLFSQARLLPSDRWFFRCRDCLSVIALDFPRETNTRTGAVLSPNTILSCICDGQYGVMGRVERKDIVNDKERCPCDDRCTSAQGPICNCVCGGKNHGSMLVVIVSVVNGKVPTIKPLDSKEAKQRASEYRDARDAAMFRLATMPGAKFADRRIQGEWLQGADYGLCFKWRREQQEFRKACLSKVHKVRIKKLVSIGLPNPSPTKD